MALGLSVDDARLIKASFFEISRRFFAPTIITDEKRIRALTQHLMSLRPLPTESYLQQVRILRVEHRRSTVLHGLKNFYRTKWRSDLIRLAMTRIKFLWSIRKAEVNQPDLVYQGPSYVRPGQLRRFLARYSGKPGGT